MSDTNPYESPEYQAFVESMIQHCHCSLRLRPCDGVLAGGVCDGVSDDEKDWQAFDDSDDE